MLASYGWTSDRDAECAPFPGLFPARVVLQEREAYLVQTAEGEQPAEVSGRFRHDTQTLADFPAVGDWVLAVPGEGGRAQIQHILPRRGVISRKVAWQRTDEQVLAANVDVVLLVSSAEDLNARRLERFLIVARESGARPVVVLNKIDRTADLDAAVALAVATAGPATDIRLASALTGEGIDGLAAYLDGGRTVVLLGPSGAGKSTITNAIAGTALETGGLRADGRGRHTTTRRELVLVSGRGLIVDTPGLRELQPWQGDLDTTFADVVAAAARCRFDDCAHAREPGCAVQSAIAAGELDSRRLDAFRKIGRELVALERRKDKHAMAEERRRWRVLNRHPKGPR